MFKKIALLFIAILVIYTLLPDSDLTSGAELWITEEGSGVAAEDNLFNALAGLTVSPDKNMATSGMQLIAAANRTLAEFLESEKHLESGSKPAFDEYWANPALVPTEGVLILCDPRAQDCRDIWLSQNDTVQQLLAENEILLNRYRELKNYQEYHNTLVVDVRSPIPDFSTLMTLGRLYGTGIALRFIHGETSAALKELNSDMAFVRRLFSQADMLIIKMVALSMLKHDLYVYATLMDVRPDEIYLFDEIPALTAMESSLEKPAKYEFQMNMNLAREINEYPELITGKHGLPAWLPFPLYRMNHSINLIHHALNYNLEKSRLPAGEFYRQFSAKNESEDLKPGWLSYLYNPIGCILFTLSLPDFSKYIIRIHDMNGLISMINLKRHIKREKPEPDEIEAYVKQAKKKYFNPYTGGHFDWSPGEQTLSFQSPGSEFMINKLVIDFADRDAEKK
jgi:hypothetical protein